MPVLEARAKARAADESAVAIEREGARLPGTVERLSEQQLADIRTTARSIDAETAAARGDIGATTESLAAQRAALTDRTPALDGCAARSTACVPDVEGIEARIAEA